jgi:peptidoglycan/LPS O-acetylase OafA/YrhL/lysophospholipase L1-like esterase
VCLVLLFHAGMSWMPAGYLGVSVFFTLSGFLITSLLLVETEQTGHVAMGSFYGRRIRRLLPASLLCVAAIIVARFLGAFSRVPHLRADIVGAQLQVFNWVRLAGSSSYAALFAGGATGVTSPLEHYWSLAIEEQFYWLWPVVLVLLVRWTTRRGRSLAATLGALTALFAIAALVIAHSFGPDAAYWATPARLPELLVGATLAALLRGGRTVPTAARHVAAPALGAIVALCCLLPSGRGLAYQGGLSLFAVLSAALIWSLQTPGPVRTALSWRPFVWLGRISYGVYLFHWPIDVVLRERGWNLSTLGGFAFASALTLAISAVSFVLVERPIRLAGWSPSRSLLAAGTATVCLLPVALGVPGTRPFIAVDHGLLSAAAIAPAGTGTLAPLLPTTVDGAADTVSVRLASTGAGDTSVDTAPTTLPPAPARPIRVLVVGDSTALYVAQGLAAWSVAHPAVMQADVLWRPGATLLYGTTNTSFDSVKEFRNSRDLFANEAPAMVRRVRPDLVVVMVTVNDIVTRRWTRAEGALTPFDPPYRARLTQAYHDFATTLLDGGAGQVLLVVPPTPTHQFLQPEMNDPARFAAQHDVIRAVPATFTGARAGRVAVIDLETWFTNHGHAQDPTWRPDGVHLTTDTAHRLADDYLGPTLTRRALGLDG